MQAAAARDDTLAGLEGVGPDTIYEPLRPKRSSLRISRRRKKARSPSFVPFSLSKNPLKLCKSLHIFCTYFQQRDEIRIRTNFARRRNLMINREFGRVVALGSQLFLTDV